MKFGDKLILLRKKKGMNQEELAEKLGVSRQSVSKWESNNSYPETDKIVQICNIFNCSMDDLINDNITNIDEIQRKDKNNFSVVIDSFLEFITKSINMFSSMKFTSGLKCVIEMIILTLILALTGRIITSIISSSIASIFSFVKGQYVIENVLESIFNIIWIIIEVIILIHTFKIRYLNYYDKVSNTNEEISKDEKINNKKPTVIIRDDKHAPFAFLSVLSSIVIIFAKIIIAGLVLELFVVLISTSIFLVLSIFLSISSSLFVGIDISLLAFIVINIILLIFMISFIFNKKTKYKQLLFTFLISIVVMGIGIGITIISFKDFKIVDEPLYTKTSEETLDYKDNLVIVASNLPDTEYIIDNSINNIKVEIYYNDTFSFYELKEDVYYGVNTYEVHEVSKNTSLKDAYDFVIPNLKKKQFKINFDAIKIKVYANEETINKLIDNSSKVYTFDKNEIDGGYILKNISHKIQKQDYCSEKTDYNAVTEEITTSGNCKCNINKNDNYINFICNYEE